VEETGEGEKFPRRKWWQSTPEAAEAAATAAAAMAMVLRQGGRKRKTLHTHTQVAAAAAAAAVGHWGYVGWPRSRSARGSALPPTSLSLSFSLQRSPVSTVGLERLLSLFFSLFSNIGDRVRSRNVSLIRELTLE